MYVRDVHAKQKNMGLLENLNYVCSLEMEIRDFPTFSQSFTNFRVWWISMNVSVKHGKLLKLSIRRARPKMAGICASLLDSNIRRIKCEKRWANCVYVPLENLYINEKYVENAKHKHLSLKYSANFPSNIKHFSFWLKIFQIFRQCMLS